LRVWITIPATTAGLLLSNLPKFVPLYPRARVADALTAFWLTIVASILNALLAAIAARVLGRLTL
jgi:hypothetical protein